MGHRLAHRTPVRARNIYRLPLLRTAPIRRRHPHTGAYFALRIGRRQADEKSHCRFRLVTRFQRPGKIAPSLSDKAIHTAVRTLLGADAGRFRQTPRRLRIRTGTYRRSARGIPLVSKANRPRHRNAVPAASVLEFCGLVESARVERRIRP